MTIKVIVKGTRFQAAQKMAAEGIPFAFHHEYGPPYEETCGFVGDQFLNKIKFLFHRDDNTRNLCGALPIGAVLLWSEIGAH